jgi:uncharacterized protein (DUF952 family)
MPDTIAFKIFRAEEWQAFGEAGAFSGSADDRRDGFIHMSTAEQAEETVAKHYANVAGLVVAAFDVEALGAAVRWEPSRGGALFPHVYGALTEAALVGSAELGPDGVTAACARAAKDRSPRG